jgi:CubicO group peptidase (beta-lactamase class C family)
MMRRWGRDPVRTGLVQAVEGAARQALAASTTPGLAVALVYHGQVVWAAGYGVADRTTGQPVTAATRFQAASLSKPVTAWGVLRLVEAGRIGLDEPVVGHLRRWRPPPSRFDADGLTVRRLLSHTAGLSVHGYVGQTSDRPLPSIEASLAGETGDGFPVELLAAPGRGWLYSGGGYSVLQLLVEELTGRPFVDYLQAEVLDPLGMTASSFQWSRTFETARPHDANGRAIPDFVFAEQAAAGLVTTAPDLARFLAAALAGPRGEPGGRGVLSPAGVGLALTAAPATEGRWGLGYGLGILAGGDRLAYHEGANRGWRAGLALLPDRRAGIALPANGDAGSGRMQGRTNRRCAAWPRPSSRRPTHCGQPRQRMLRGWPNSLTPPTGTTSSASGCYLAR